ncbi:MAG TPA: hypothetical protein VGG98_02780 [Solirubrobacteraceae bacterium]
MDRRRCAPIPTTSLSNTSSTCPFRVGAIYGIVANNSGRDVPGQTTLHDEVEPTPIPWNRR